jgi:T5SS/PEP-CTERM-associated repeat protein
MRLFPRGIDGSATAIAFIGIVAFAGVAPGQIATWKGDEFTMEGDWDEPENWIIFGQPGVPGADNPVEINNSGTARISSGAMAGYVVLGQSESDAGTLEITGADASFSSVTVGDKGSGNLEINGGAVAVENDLSIGSSAGSNGAFRLNGGALSRIFQLSVGRSGAGVLEINGGTVSDLFGSIGEASGASGAVMLTGSSTWTNEASLGIGGSGAGTLSITGNSTVTNTSGSIGGDGGASGVVVVAGGSTWTNSSFLRVANFGTGSLEITGGSTVAASFAAVGTAFGASGTVRVNGATFTTTSNLIVGNSGTGTLDIVNGGIVSNAYSTIASNTDSIGSVLVSGSNSKWLNITSLTVAGAGTGTLQITSGASVENESSSIGSNSGSVGEVTVSGGSAWTIAEALLVGSGGTGMLEITGSSTVQTARAIIGDGGASTGVVLLDGNSVWTNRGVLEVAHHGTGMMKVMGGAKVTTGYSFVGAGVVGSTGSVLITGADSKWDITLDLVVGHSGMGTLEITAGGKVTSHPTQLSSVIGLGSDSSGSVRVDGAGAEWTVGSDLTVGDAGAGDLQIVNGGHVSNGVGIIGANFAFGSSGSVLVDGTGSKWTLGSTLFVGGLGTGELKILNGGGVTSNSAVIGKDRDSIGTVLVDGADSKWTNSGDLRVGGVGLGTLIINDGKVEAAKVIIGPQGAVLGNGLIMGSVANHGRLAPGQSIGALTIDGNYEQTDGVLEMEVSGPNEGQSDQLIVTGDATLGGTLEMVFLDGYAPRAGDMLELFSVRGGFVEQGLNIELANLMPGFEYQTGFNMASGMFSLTALNNAELMPLAGDYNGNGRVDAADYVVWRANVGAATLNNRDVNSTGVVGQADYDFWRANFGRTAVTGSAATRSASGAIPEPASLGLLLLAAIIGAQCRSRRRYTLGEDSPWREPAIAPAAGQRTRSMYLLRERAIA